MFKQFSKPLIFGHRGACALAPENTISSFKLAVEHGADFIELDAKLSSDGVVMVIHDPTVDRTTNGTGTVNQMTLAQLKELDAGSKFDEKFAGEKIPTLDEVFKAVGNDVLINVELTNYTSQTDRLIPSVVELVEKNGLKDRVLFSSFLPGNLKWIHQLLPEAPVGLLCLEGFAGSMSRSFFAMNISPNIIHPYLADLNPKYVAKEHKRGRRVHTWTVNYEDDVRRVVSAGVDGIFTDNPKATREIMESMLK